MRPTSSKMGRGAMAEQGDNMMLKVGRERKRWEREIKEMVIILHDE
jgi:hypothetical protein